MPTVGIKQLIQEPFGPYPDYEILRPDFRPGTVLKLRSFAMYCGDEQIGQVPLTLPRFKTGHN
jgi:hypothetical protein